MDDRHPAPSRTVVWCDAALLPVTAETVDALARIQLRLKRRRAELRLEHASADLLALIDFMGLRGVLTQQPADTTQQT